MYDQIKQRDLELSSKSQYIYHNRITAFSTEYSSRQGIKKKIDSSDGILYPNVFQVVSWLLGSLTIDLFTFHLCHQLLQQRAWHSGPHSQRTDATIQNWIMGISYASPLLHYDFRSAPKK